MSFPDYILKNKKKIKKIFQGFLIVIGTILLFQFEMIVAGSLLLVLGYFSVLKND